MNDTIYSPLTQNFVDEKKYPILVNNINWAECPGTAVMQESMGRYIIHHEPVGDFLTSILENNLRLAFAYADNSNLALMHDWVLFLHYEIPGVSWGSPEKVKAWLSHTNDG
jgi:hypothetical protein